MVGVDRKQNIITPRGVCGLLQPRTSKKINPYRRKTAKNLVVSKKHSTFAPQFRNEAQIYCFSSSVG